MGRLTREIIDLPTFMTFHDIAADILARIKSGEYQPGSQLPSYRELAVLYSVHLSTATRAYGKLHTLGAIMSHPGKGVFVAEVPPVGPVP